MKTRYKYIHFERKPQDPLGNKILNIVLDQPETVHPKAIWHCYSNRGKVELGWCEYYAEWNQWIYVSECDGIIYSHDCLTHIANFLQQLNKEIRYVA